MIQNKGLQITNVRFLITIRINIIMRIVLALSPRTKDSLSKRRL